MKAENRRLQNAVANAMPMAERLFAELRARTADGAGVSRESYGQGEQIAHDILTAAAVELGAKTQVDFAGNLYMTLPGTDPALPGWLVGSHLDSVPCGGNFDGAAGVIAGIAALHAIREEGLAPARDVTVMAVRAEEASSWYAGSHGGHIGSRAAVGALPPQELKSAINIHSGQTLEVCMKAAGFDPAAVASRRRHLEAGQFHGYLELHIEQGPVLENRALPVGIVTGIRGSLRARNAKCIGEYTHSGAVPHEYRKDAVLATSELCFALDRTWDEIRSAGGDLVFTVGRFSTNAKLHSLSKVPGETAFTIDFRSQDPAILDRMGAITRSLSADIAKRRRVSFELGEFDVSAPAIMDETFQGCLAQGATELGITHMALPSGAGHDAQDFAHAGFRSAMIFVRNANGSHNAAEAMDMNDFRLGTTLLTWMMLQ